MVKRVTCGVAGRTCVLPTFFVSETLFCSYIITSPAFSFHVPHQRNHTDMSQVPPTANSASADKAAASNEISTQGKAEQIQAILRADPKISFPQALQIFEKLEQRPLAALSTDNLDVTRSVGLGCFDLSSASPSWTTHSPFQRGARVSRLCLTVSSEVFREAKSRETDVSTPTPQHQRAPSIRPFLAVHSLLQTASAQATARRVSVESSRCRTNLFCA